MRATGLRAHRRLRGVPDGSSLRTGFIVSDDGLI
ncbi:hypothetical protein VVAX_06731 [Variovorax paradoxus]|jgi:hypothetical protein|uniref:Uncharacterized protein n=1 Tax=Variovorax paradoxus TaxID=34073 RepID=A0A679JT34_VARPD|nr:hypothetical protein VVAX_06731 [Variovorax paradoxus]